MFHTRSLGCSVGGFYKERNKRVEWLLNAVSVTLCAATPLPAMEQYIAYLSVTCLIDPACSSRIECPRTACLRLYLVRAHTSSIIHTEFSLLSIYLTVHSIAAITAMFSRKGLSEVRHFEIELAVFNSLIYSTFHRIHSVWRKLDNNMPQIV